MVEVTDGLWQFTARHPEWNEDEGGEDGWEPDVAWWAYATEAGLLLIDPLVDDWRKLERLASERGGCVGIVRTCHWHQRSIPDAAIRLGASVWAARSTTGERLEPCDRELVAGDELAGGGRVIGVERADELAVWIPAASALVFGDAMIRGGDGGLRVCPPSWTQPPGGRRALLAQLDGLRALRPEHILVSHGPLVTGDGGTALERALAMAEGEG